jgi:hypothetical protein
MSKKILETTEVINEVKDQFQSRKKNSSVRQIRIESVAKVASGLGIKKETVLDKFIRQLQPDINTASEFDTLLENWLRDDSPDLKNILLKHASGRNDKDLINKAFYKAPEEDILLAEEFGLVPYDPEFVEGKEKLKIHLVKERSRTLVNAAKENWLKENKGTVSCITCSFSFDETYGEIGKGYIEAHHKLPISNIASDTVIKIGDLAPVCSNCHSIIHRSRPWLTIEQLKEIVGKRHV